MKYQFIKKYPTIWLYFFFFFFSGSFQLFLYISNYSGFSGLRESLIFCSLPLIPILLWPKKSKLLAVVLGVPMLIGAWASLGYWMINGQEFSQSPIFIIGESNMAESYEFVTSYIRWWHVFVFIVFSIIPIYMEGCSTNNDECIKAICTCRIVFVRISLAGDQYWVNQWCWLQRRFLPFDEKNGTFSAMEFSVWLYKI